MKNEQINLRHDLDFGKCLKYKMEINCEQHRRVDFSKLSCAHQDYLYKQGYKKSDIVKYDNLK